MPISGLKLNHSTIPLAQHRVNSWRSQIHGQAAPPRFGKLGDQPSALRGRLARNGPITHRPHANTYDLTPDGLAFAVFYTKVHDRVLAPLFAAGQPQAPPQLRAALHTIELHIDQLLAAARLPAAA